MLCTSDEINAVIQDMPFSPEEIAAAEAANPDVEHLYVYLMDNAPECGEIEKLAAGYAGPDKLCAGRREIYLLCHQSIRDSKPAAALGKLGVPMTSRNWKTMNKLCEMLID